MNGERPSAEDEDWKKRLPEAYMGGPPPDESAGTVVSIEDTVAAVKENMWYFGDAALKSVAEVLYGFGISPTVLGYSEEELMEEEEGEGYGDDVQQRAQKDQVVAKTSFARMSEEKLQRRKAEDETVSEEHVQQQQQEEEAAAAAAYEQNEEGWFGSADNLILDFVDDKKDK